MQEAKVYEALDSAYASIPHIATSDLYQNNLSPLMLAVKNGNYFAVKWLFDQTKHKGKIKWNKPEIQLTDKAGQNALLYGVSYEDIQEPNEESKESEGEYEIGSIKSRRKILEVLLVEYKKLKEPNLQTYLYALRHNNQRFLGMHKYHKEYVVSQISEACHGWFHNDFSAKVKLDAKESTQFKEPILKKYKVTFIEAMTRIQEIILPNIPNHFERDFPDIARCMCFKNEEVSSTFKRDLAEIALVTNSTTSEQSIQQIVWCQNFGFGLWTQLLYEFNYDHSDNLFNALCNTASWVGFFQNKRDAHAAKKNFIDAFVKMVGSVSDDELKTIFKMPVKRFKQTNDKLTIDQNGDDKLDLLSQPIIPSVEEKLNDIVAGLIDSREEIFMRFFRVWVG